MAQFARPTADTTLGSYTDQAGGSTNIYTTIDEASPSDSDYIRSPLAPSSAVYVTKLGTLEDPQSSSNHVVRYRIAKDTAGGAQIDATVQLREGYVNESTLGTLIAEWTHTNVSETFATQTQTLSAAEADAITQFDSLFLRISASQV